jgi:site-specific DNA recombinase
LPETATCSAAFTLGDVLTDNDRSATRFATKDRPEYEKLRSTLQPGDVLVVWEASRAGRSLDHYVDLRRLCAERGVMLSYSGKPRSHRTV